MHPNDAAEWVGEAEHDETRRAVREVFGLENVVLSTLVPENTSLVGSFREGATLFVRQGFTLGLSAEHSDYFLRGLVAVSVEGCYSLRTVHTSAFCTVTGA